ncbi:hypothetical protein ACIQGZ_12775 [Streptomyces sp. NPDC092296]|uniref:hypothetical protein n=1 Tax=Streptomyces sp. NPDC092296 TaxID=3366012 RepID=UPI003816E0EE
MLKSNTARAALTAVSCVLVLLGMVAAGTADAAARSRPPGGSVWECHTDVICVGVKHPGSPGSSTTGGSSGGGSTGGGGTQTCHWYGQEVPCYLSDAGWFSSADGCYYKLESPQPDSLDGQAVPAGSAVYDRMCRAADTNTLTGAPPVVLANAPVPPPPPPTPEEVMAEAVKEMPFTEPKLHSAPGPDGKPLVGLALWLWYDKVPGAEDTISKTVSIRGVTVTATARLRRVVWDMGDGSTVNCPGAGTPYRAADGSAESPNCGYRYQKSSAGRQHDSYTVSAVLHWRITGAATGPGAHAINPIADYTTGSQGLELPVGEVQVLN